MTVSDVEPYKIENQDEADDYLDALLSSNDPRIQTTDEIELRAQRLVPDATVRAYFISEAKRRLKS